MRNYKDSDKLRLAVLTTHPIQYHTPIWRRLAQYQDLELHVYFGSDLGVRGYVDKEFGIQISWDLPLLEGYPYTFLSTDPTICESKQLNLKVLNFQKRILAFQPDYVLLTGYYPFTFYLKAAFVLRWLGIPILLRGEATDEALPRSPVKALARHLFLKFLYSQMWRFLVIGENARRHYLARGVSPRRLFWSPYSVDTFFFAEQVQQWLPQRSVVRHTLVFSEDQIVFLYCGKLIPKKDPLIIPAAFRYIGRSLGAPLGLLVVGDGPLLSALEAEMATIPTVQALFVGFQNQSTISRFYSVADCLILPSSWGETWGLVVNEALQFGIPAVVSDRVGCRHDLIIEGETGYVFPTGNALALAQCLEQVVTLLRDRRDAVSKACWQKASEYSLERTVIGIREALYQ